MKTVRNPSERVNFICKQFMVLISGVYSPATLTNHRNFPTSTGIFLDVTLGILYHVLELKN